MAARDWRAITARKQQQLRNSIPDEWRLKASQISDSENVVLDAGKFGILTQAELKITEAHDATSLLADLAAGKLKSEDVVKAFCKRAAVAQQVTNCLTEVLFDDALSRARQLDELLASNGRPMGPLHGLPISMKDTFRIRGYDSSLGIASLCFKPAEDNSALVEQLYALGAVVHCKTNVPQTMMALDSHNNVFGRTLNPFNQKLTAGGSSGGEGALIAMKASPLGIGTDVGGSVRIPAMCNELYGVKPSHQFVPFAGQEGGLKPGSTRLSVEPTAGPIARSLRDCELLLRVVADNSPETYDPEVTVQPWARQIPLNTENNKPLRVGIIRTDGHTQPLPPIDRLMQDVSQTLEAAGTGIEVIQVDASALLTSILKTFNACVSIDGGQAWFAHLEATGEPLSPWLQGRLQKRPQKSLDEVRDLQVQKSDHQTAFLKVWQEKGGYWLTDDSRAKKGDRKLDVLVMPVAPHPVPTIDSWNTVNYTASLNLLDLSTGVLPIRTVKSQDLEGEVPSTPPLNGWDKINSEHWTKVDRKVYLGSPLSVQVVTPRLTERRLLEAMTMLEAALKPLKSADVKIRSSKL